MHFPIKNGGGILNLQRCKVTIIDQKTLNDEYYEKNYSKNQLNSILNETG